MIDLHHHCLPGVDDGPREWDEAAAMCRMAAEEGIETIVATPHVLRGRWRSPSRPELEQKIDELRQRVGASPRLLLGSEYFFAHDMPDVLRDGTSIVPLADSHYVLVEFASNAVPPLVEQPFYRLQLDGWTPLIAHPERNLVFRQKPELLLKLIERGARTQVTAGSLTGEFGEEAARAAETWIAAGMVHVVATDAHNTTKRPPKMREALERLRELAGERVATALTRENPEAIINDRALAWDPEPSVPASPGFLSRLRRLFRGQ